MFKTHALKKVMNIAVLGVCLPIAYASTNMPSTAAHGVVIQDNEPAPLIARVYTPVITFSEYSTGTTITNQYQNRGIIFGSNAFISVDGASNRAPVLSGSPQFNGPITGYFVDPLNPVKRVAASAISMRVGYLDSQRSVRLYLYDKNNKLIQYHTTSALGFENINIKLKSQPIWHWKIMTVADEPAGYAIDDFAAELVTTEAKAEIKMQADPANSPGRSPEPVTGKDITVSIELKDADGNIIPDATFTQCTWNDIPDPSGGWLGLWGALVTKEGDLSNKCQLKFQYTKDTGPDDLTYGNKTIAFTGKFSVVGATEQSVTLNKSFKVFFDKTAQDDGANPNWFTYWKDNGAVPGLNASHVQYKSLSNSYGQFDPSKDIVYLSDLAAEVHYPTPITVPSGANCPGGTYGGAKGIDSVKEVLVHENKHKEYWDNWHKGLLFTVWTIGVDADSDDPTPNVKELNNDLLPDNYETALGTSPTNNDSCNLSVIRSSAGYAVYGDQEFAVMQAANNQKGVPEKDWANPGAQTNPKYRSLVNVSQPLVAEDKTYGSRLMNKNDFDNLSYMVNSQNTVFGHLLDIYSDEMVDANNDGIDDYLSIKTKAHFVFGGAFDLIVYLADAQNQPFLVSTLGATAIVGDNDLELRIDAQLLREHGMSGAFTLKGIELIGADVIGGPIESKLDAYTTQPYYFDPAPPKVFVFTDTNYDDRGVDINGNGLFEYIEVDVEVEVNQSGTYRFESSAGLAKGGRTIDLPVGKSVIWLPLGLKGVVTARDTNPLAMTVIRAFDANNNEVAIVHPDYVLKTQGLEKFEPLIAKIDETSLRDMPVNLDNNPKIDFIGLDMAIVAQLEGVGPYWLSYKVYDKHGALITEVDQYLELRYGRQTFGFSIPADPFVRHGVDGPYYLRTFFLDKESGGRVDSLEMFEYETQAYRVEDLQSYDEPSDHELVITPETLSDGRVNQPYQQQFSSENGISPYVFTVPEGQLPLGLTLTAAGNLSGIPSEAGSYSFTIQVMDMEYMTGLQNYTLHIAPAAVLNCPSLTSVSSVKGQHALPASLNANGSYTLIEPRNGTHVLKLVFDQNISLTEWQAQLQAGGTLNIARGSNDKEVMISFPATDAVTHAVGFTAISGEQQGCRYALEASFFWGDVNQDRKIDNTDYVLITGRVGSAITANTFIYDIDNNGSVNSIDKRIVQKRLGMELP